MTDPDGLGPGPDREAAGPEPGSPSAAGREPGRDRSDTTADPRVADALSRLAELEVLPLGEQVEVFADVHRRLAAVLADPASRG